MTTRPGAPRTGQLAELQSARFRLMTELGRGSTPMRRVNEVFEHAVRSLSGTLCGSALVLAVERAVRAELDADLEVA